MIQEQVAVQISPKFRHSLVRLQLIIAAAIFTSEVAVMACLYLFPAIPTPLAIVIDAGLLLLFLVPVLRYLIFNPLVAQIAERERAEAQLLEHQKNLEKVVAERTSQLSEVVANLERQVTEREEIEAALRSSQERFLQLFQQSEDAIILFRQGTTKIVDINPLVESMFGYSKQELFSGGPACFCGGADLHHLCRTVAALQGGDTFQIQSFSARRRDNSLLLVSVRGKIVTIQNLDFVYCTFHDITERVRVEEEARLIQSKMIHTNKMTSLGVLAASIAHEINNPNNYILANGEFLEKMYSDIMPILKEYYRDNGDFLLGGVKFSQMGTELDDIFGGIRDGSLRIRDIINSLKAFARNEPPNPEKCIDLNEVVTLAVSIMNHQIKKHTTSFRTSLHPALPLIRGSMQQLEQVIINLIMNALQALPDPARRVEVITATEAGGVVLQVRDEGDGIPSGVASRILEPFFTTRLESGGTGLGLSISYSIIKEHHGSLEFQSEPGVGTVFTIRFPTAEACIGESHE